MSKENILVIDDEKDIRDLVSYNLKKNGFNVITVATGEDGIAQARLLKPDLILLDLMLPGIDGLDVCRTLKSDSTTSGIPVIMLTARSEEIDVVTGLEIGADDYITKPFSPRVLIARVRAMLRGINQKESSDGEGTIKRGELTIDLRKHEVRLGEELVSLTHTEFQVLHHLAKHPGWVFTRNQIIDAIHGDKYAVTERSVDVQIVGLRRKLGASGQKIEAVRGIGYRFRD